MAANLYMDYIIRSLEQIEANLISITNKYNSSIVDIDRLLNKENLTNIVTVKLLVINSNCELLMKNVLTSFNELYKNVNLGRVIQRIIDDIIYISKLYHKIGIVCIDDNRDKLEGYMKLSILRIARICDDCHNIIRSISITIATHNAYPSIP